MSPEPALQKFYITGGRETTDGTPRDDRTVPAIVCYGKDSLDALGRSGITVWPEEDYLRAMKSLIGQP